VKMLRKIVDSAEVGSGMPRDWMSLADAQKEAAGTALSALLALRPTPNGLARVLALPDDQIEALSHLHADKMAQHPDFVAVFKDGDRTTIQALNFIHMAHASALRIARDHGYLVPA
jgi:hypothetical protein